MNEQTLFNDAAELTDPTRRAEFLDRACSGDPALRRRVEALLALNEEAGEFLETPPPPMNRPASDRNPDVESSPTRLELPFLASDGTPGELGVLGHYVIRGEIGRGAMGFVFQAHDVELERMVAVKLLSPSLAANPEARRRFVREARAAAAVVHPNIVTIHSVGESKGVPYIVMEYVQGNSLADLIGEGRPLDAAEIVRIGTQVAEGLAAAHRQGLVHRDVKPANVLLESGTRRVKITDFGLARSLDDETLTTAGAVVGTPQFMSPEQALGEKVDHRTDLFSLGGLLYALCVGRPPFRADTTIATLRRVCDSEPKPIEDLNPEIPAGLVGIIEKLLRKKAADRYQTAVDARDALAALEVAPALESPDRASRREVGGGGGPDRVARGRRAAAVLSSLGVMSLLVWALAAGVLRPPRRPDPAPKPAPPAVAPGPPPETTATRLRSREYVWIKPIELGRLGPPESIRSFPQFGDGDREIYFGVKSTEADEEDIWVASRSPIGDDWGPGEKLPPPINSPKNDSGAFLSSDGLTLYFHSSREGTYGGTDLWSSERASKNGPWREPKNLGERINSPGTEETPFVTADGLTLLFTSSRPEGAGWFDIYESRRESPDAPWGMPVPLGPEINTADWEGCARLSADGLALLYHSGRGVMAATRSTTNSPWSKGDRLECAPEFVFYTHPGATPDFRSILFVRRDEGRTAPRMYLTRLVRDPAASGGEKTVPVK